jgi:hypothetical protein
MSASMQNLEKAIDRTVRVLGAWEKVHEVYAVGSVEAFYSNYEAGYQKYIVEAIKVFDGNERRQEERQLSTKLADLVKGHLDLVKSLKAAYDEFKGIRMINTSDMRSAIDRFRREVLEKDPNRPFTDRNRSLGGRKAISDMLNPTGITTSNVTMLASSVQQEYDKIYRNIVPVLKSLGDDGGELNSKLGSDFSGRIASAMAGDHVMAVNSIVTVAAAELDKVVKFVDAIAGIYERLGDKTFDRYLNDFHKGVSNGTKILLQDKYVLEQTKDTYTAIASLDALYESGIVSQLSAMIDGAYKAIEVEAQAMKRGPEATKKVDADLKALRAAMTLAKPDNHKSPNYGLVRGTRFLWSDTKARLDTLAIGNTFGDGKDDIDRAIEEQGFLYRKPDKERLAYYRDMVKAFGQDVRFDGTNIANVGQMVRSIVMGLDAFKHRTEAVIQSAVKDAAALTDDDPAYKAYQLQRIGRAKERVIENYFREAKRFMSRALQIHVDFALKTNRQAMRYMIYWKQMDVANGEARQLINEYEDLLLYGTSSVRKHGMDMMNSMHKNVSELFENTEMRKQIVEHMEDEQAEKLLNRFQTFNEWFTDVYQRIATVHQQPANIFDVIADNQIILIYALKLIRYSFIIIALAIARRAFTAMYVQKVYESNLDPPHPIIMIGIFLGVEVSLALALLVILYFAKYMFFHGAGTFPVDDYLLSRWMLDYLSSTIVIAILGIIFSDVIRKRKYFRYRYEGERGIRALEVLMRWTSGIIMLLPFYRLAD